MKTMEQKEIQTESSEQIECMLCARIEELEKEKLELNEQLDIAQQEREVLAAHVERCQKFLEDMHMMPTDWTIMESQRIHADKPEASLARLKAQWQAEAFWQFITDIEKAGWETAPASVLSALCTRCAELRRQAEGGEE